MTAVWSCRREQARVGRWMAASQRMLQWAVAAGLALMLAGSVMWAGTNGAPEGEIPSLHPPRGEIGPGLWEQYSGWFMGGGVVALLLLAVLIWYLTRPRPPEIVPAAVVAREALDRLAGQPETGVVLSQISHAVRGYFLSVLGLGEPELTTTEFCGAISGRPELGPELAESVAAFLRQCDELKFAPLPASPPVHAVARALGLVEQTEARALELRKPAPAAAGGAAK
jgi:hypothetical protein